MKGNAIQRNSMLRKARKGNARQQKATGDNKIQKAGSRDSFKYERVRVRTLKSTLPKVKYKNMRAPSNYLH